jgi:hypothetical protein
VGLAGCLSQGFAATKQGVNHNTPSQNLRMIND